MIVSCIVCFLFGVMFPLFVLVSFLAVVGGMCVCCCVFVYLFMLVSFLSVFGCLIIL